MDGVTTCVITVLSFDTGVSIDPYRISHVSFHV